MEIFLIEVIKTRFNNDGGESVISYTKMPKNPLKIKQDGFYFLSPLANLLYIIGHEKENST